LTNRSLSHTKHPVKLSDVSLDTQVKLSALEDFPSLRAKLNQHGLYQGDVLRVLRVAPFGGPLLIQVNGREIALGREVAEKIFVELE
jgi:Fe2+ transport system protein FeoA